MKKLFLIISLTIIHFTANCQIQDITQLAKGELVFTDIIFDNEADLWGYFYLYKVDTEKGKEKMEYVVLDKNLNKINNGVYYTPKYPSNSYYRVYNNCMLMGDQLVLDISVIMINRGLLYNSNLTISLKEDSKTDEFMMIKGSFSPVPEKLSVFKSANTYDSLYNVNIVDPIYRGEKKGYLISQHNMSMNSNIIKEKQISIYNENKEHMWTYVYNKNTSNRIKDKYTTFRFLTFYNNKIIAYERDYVKNKFSSGHIIGLNFDTGKKEFEFELENDTSKYFYNYNTKTYNDTLYIVGRYFNNKKFGPDANYLGYFRVAIDENGKEISKKYVPWAELSTPEITFTKKGRVFKTHYLANKSVLTFKDGSTSIVTEEEYYQPDILAFLRSFSFFIIDIAKSYSKDAYVINFDKNFNFTGINRIEKKKNYYFNDFLYTQYTKDNSSAVACFKSTKKVEGKKEQELIINTLKNGSVQTEKIPLTARDQYYIAPIPAKEGYIMLREYNEKAKYNQIRLERINN